MLLCVCRYGIVKPHMLRCTNMFTERFVGFVSLGRKYMKEGEINSKVKCSRISSDAHARDAKCTRILKRCARSSGRIEGSETETENARSILNHIFGKFSLIEYFLRVTI